MIENEHMPDELLVAGYYNFSPVVNLSDEQIYGPFFSRTPCDTCGSKLTGDRFYCTATIGQKHAGKRETFEICTDCYQYFFAQECSDERDM